MIPTRPSEKRNRFPIRPNEALSITLPNDISASEAMNIALTIGVCTMEQE